MSNLENTIEDDNRFKAAQIAEQMRVASQQAKVFEPSPIEVNDAKREAWNRTVTKIKEIYGLDASVIQPDKNMDKYSITSGKYISGPAYIGLTRFEFGSRINVLSEEDPGIDYGTDTIVPYVYKYGEYGTPASEVYSALADALEQYSTNGHLHKDSIGAANAAPDTLTENGPAESLDVPKTKSKPWWRNLF